MIYLDASSATLKSNDYAGNEAALGESIYGIGSTIDGRSTSLFRK